MKKLDWKETPGGAFEAGPYLVAERVDGKGWNAQRNEAGVDELDLASAVPREVAMSLCEAHAEGYNFNLRDRRPEFVVSVMIAKQHAHKLGTEHTTKMPMHRDLWADENAAIIAAGRSAIDLNPGYHIVSVIWMQTDGEGNGRSGTWPTPSAEEADA